MKYEVQNPKDELAASSPKKLWRLFLVGTGVYGVLFMGLLLLVWVHGPFTYLRLFITGTVLNSSRAYIAEWFLSPEQIREASMLNGWDTVSVEPVITDKDLSFEDEANGLRIETIQGRHFKGKVMLVADPTQVRVAVTAEMGVAGQRLAQMVEQEGGIAGVNAGGFYDPDSQGNGAYPEGVTILHSRIVHNSTPDRLNDIIGLTKEGKLLLGYLGAEEAVEAGIEQAVTFSPFLLLDGQPKIAGDGGWGLAPRTGIGQRPDGTLILVVIDGRNPGWSMGATLRDLMNVFIEYGALNAANLDGGSSTEMVYLGQTVNRLWNIFGSRYMATAFVVMPKEPS